MNLRNWDGTENQVMKGYILKAFNDWNSENPEKKIENETLENLFTALKWVTDDFTADEAYHYYQSH